MKKSTIDNSTTNPTANPATDPTIDNLADFAIDQNDAASTASQNQPEATTVQTQSASAQDQAHATTQGQPSTAQADPAGKTAQNQPQPNAPADQLAEAQAKIAELTNDLQRTRADFENYRKQIELQKTQAVMIAKFSVIDQFLPLIDNFERAMQTYPEQLAPLEKSFNKTIREAGLARIDSAAGTEFNPDLHDAVMIEDGDGDTEVITETLRPGYTYNGSVVRTAMVKVKHQ